MELRAQSRGQLGGVSAPLSPIKKGSLAVTS
jgi:hypothetical protein